MFEVKEEDLLKEMLEKIPNDLDKREGSSLIYNALAPAAQEISRLRSDMDRFLEYTFASPNIPDEYLDKRCVEHGIERKSATCAIKLGTFYDTEDNLIDIPLKSRFSMDKTNYIATERIEKGKYKMQCELIGTKGNYPSGNLLPIEYIEGLGKGVLGETILDGVDTESNESLFNRLMVKVRTPSTSGNKYDYLNWALSVNGVGDAKVKPLWNGNGTVKVLITDTDGRAPVEDLIKKVSDVIEEKRPIGATVTVAGIKEVNIKISTKVILQEGSVLEAIKDMIISNINSYFKKISLKTNIIRFNRIVNCILDVDGIEDYKEITVNGEQNDISLSEDSIPILESVVVDSVN
ncbi:baseplate J/gp47 family protein [Clostridium botulinum]|nr:baseplate J/gp47 family protein [Clostridium botulinum]NFR12983.1 baseplate J/gp47 family protein [Clostridium botulinum]NFR43568.1 baseplate J/gp47 family protein [Clostridium botulinum]NFS49982.1 baseplate J/gp47 family protein [Clostridium botulinum]